MKILKRTGWLVLPLAVLLLAGCQTEPVQAETPEAQVRVMPRASSDASEGLLIEADVIPVSPEDFSQKFHDRLAEEWAAFDQTSPTDRVLSSHAWGACDSQFDSWSEAVDFVGIPVENPLDAQEWLIPWPHFRASDPEEEAFSVEVSLQSSDRDTIERATLYADYRTGDKAIRVQFSAGVYTESPASFIEQPLASHQQPLSSGNQALVFDLDEQNEAYVSQTAHLAEGAVLYSVYVVGESGQAEAVTETMDQILALF